MKNLGLAHFIFYLTVLSIYVYAMIFDTDLFQSGKYKKVGFPFDDSFNGRAKFLTYNNVGLQIIFFGLSTSSALFGVMNNDMGIKMRGITNFLYTSLAFPIGMLCSIVFWSLYLIDRKLVFPVILDSIMPVWLNHALHTLPIVSLLIEAYVTKHRYTTFMKGALFNAVFLCLYISWTLYIAYHTDNWVYPILKMLAPIYRAMFIATNCLLSVFMYRLGEFLNSIFWSVRIKTAWRTFWKSTVIRIIYDFQLNISEIQILSNISKLKTMNYKHFYV